MKVIGSECLGANAILMLARVWCTWRCRCEGIRGESPLAEGFSCGFSLGKPILMTFPCPWDNYPPDG